MRFVSVANKIVQAVRDRSSASVQVGCCHFTLAPAAEARVALNNRLDCAVRRGESRSAGREGECGTCFHPHRFGIHRPPTLFAHARRHTGFQSKELIVSANLTLGDLDQYPVIDVTLDGADE